MDSNKTAGEEARRQLHKNAASLNKSWRQHPTRHQLYGHLPPITKTIQVRRARHAGHCWRSRDELLWTPTHGRAKAGRPALTYIQQLCEDTGCCPEDLPEAMNDWEKWRERVRDIRATSTTWWWWWWLIVRNYSEEVIFPRLTFSYNLMISVFFIKSSSRKNPVVIVWEEKWTSKKCWCVFIYGW